MSATLWHPSPDLQHIGSVSLVLGCCQVLRDLQSLGSYMSAVEPTVFLNTPGILLTVCRQQDGCHFRAHLMHLEESLIGKYWWRWESQVEISASLLELGQECLPSESWVSHKSVLLTQHSLCEPQMSSDCCEVEEAHPEKLDLLCQRFSFTRLSGKDFLLCIWMVERPFC